MIIMNQIFKVVYSTAKQCYVVTSEFAKSNGKKASIVAAALILTSGIGAVNAADVDNLDTRLTSLETTVSKINAKVTAGTPGAAANNAQIEENKVNIEKNKTEIEKQATRVDGVVDEVNNLADDVAANGEKIDTNASDILTNKEAIAANTEKIKEAIESVNANNTAITTLKESVDKDEEKLNEVDEAVQANRNDIDINTTNIETNKQEIKNAEANTKTNERIDKVKELTAKAIANSITELGNQVLNPLSKDVEKNENNISELKKQHSEHETSITNLEGRTSALEAVKGTKEGLEMLKNVEAKVDGNTKKIQAAGLGLKAVTEAIGDLDTKIGEETMKAKNAAVEAAAANTETKVNAAKSELESEIKTAKTEAEGTATSKASAAKTEAIATADEHTATKITEAKAEIAGDITKAKNEAITTAGENADAKITAAKTALETKFQGLDNTTVKLEKYDKDIAALQETEKAHDVRITAVEKDVKTVGASAAALAALKPLQYNPGQTTQIMAGVGTYRGQNAVALGAAHYISENLMYHAGVSFGNGSGTMANAGVTIGFGSGESVKAESPKVAQLQSAVDRLTAENEQVKAALYDIYAKLQAK